MNFPENLKYTKDHEWVRVEGNQAFIGITDFAQKELGDMDEAYNEIEELEKKIIEAGMSKEAKAKADSELNKLKLITLYALFL